VIRHVDAIVLGGGMAGLAAADAFQHEGLRVLLVEAAPEVGGLARSIVVGGEPIEPYYHHVFPQDAETRDLIVRLGRSSDLEWLPARMAIVHRGLVWPFDGPADLLRFGALSLPSRLRLALATGVQVLRRDVSRLDRNPVGLEGPRWFGREAYDVVWRPLLTAKFGDRSDEVAMAWLRARLVQRWGARGATGDRLGYLRGGIGRLATAFAEDLRARDVELRVGQPATGLSQVEGEWVLTTASSDGPIARAPIVVAALAGNILQGLIDLPDPYRHIVGAIPYRGIVCALVVLSQQISPYYWTNVTDRLGLGCVGIIEHTNLVDAARYGGRHLVYLAHYVDPSGPAWSASADGLLGGVEGVLQTLNPRFRRDWVLDMHVARDPYAQPVPLAGGPMRQLTVRTGLAGLYHASLAHVYPDDRGVSMALDIGRRAAAAGLEDDRVAAHGSSSSRLHRG